MKITNEDRQGIEIIKGRRTSITNEDYHRNGNYHKMKITNGNYHKTEIVENSMWKICSIEVW